MDAERQDLRGILQSGLEALDLELVEGARAGIGAENEGNGLTFRSSSSYAGCGGVSAWIDLHLARPQHSFECRPLLDIMLADLNSGGAAFAARQQGRGRASWPDR